MGRTGVDVTVALRRGDDEIACWSLGRYSRADLALAEDLARLCLAARRMGCVLELERPAPEVLELLALVGLRGVVAPAALRVEVVGEAEGAEQLGVEEAVVPDDPVP